MIDNGSVSELRVLLLDQGEGMWGTQQALMRLAPLLDERGIEQILAAPAGPLAHAWTSAGRLHELLPAPRGRSARGRSGRPSVRKAMRELIRTIVTGARIAKIARANRVNVIVANNHWSHLEGVVAGRLARLPVLLYLHVHHKNDALGRLRRFAVRNATRTVAVSDSVRRALPASMWERVEVIRNGTPAAAAVSDATRERLRAELGVLGRRVVIALSRYEHDKGLDDLINAVADMPDTFDDVQLLLAGGAYEGDPTELYLRRLAEERMPGRVQFLGFRADAQALLTLADVCVLPSHTEGLGIVALEAQAAGCPFVAAAAGGIPEIVEHGVSGLLFPPGDVEQLSAELARVLSDSELRSRLRANGLAHVSREGTLERQAESLARILHTISS
jgi:glycosyltransferase involved in cell wall biosynthesis